tara:strand:+ start:263 stop:598 length:336 start_codon:yes stop_codon:yes gene_type:complete
MRKITQDAIRAFYNKEDFKRSNTQVRYNLNMMSAVSTMVMYLHGHAIAKLTRGQLWIRHAGYTTNTTKERLNGLNGVHIQQKNFIWYLNGVEWKDGYNWLKVSDFSIERFG